MDPNDVRAYAYPLRSDVAALSQAGMVQEAKELISWLLAHEALDACERERLVLEAHVLDVRCRDFPYDEAEAAALLGGDDAASRLSRLRKEGKIPFALVDGRIHYHRRFLDTLRKDEVSPHKQADLDLRAAVIQRMLRFGHAEASFTVHVGLRFREGIGGPVVVELPVPVVTPFLKDFAITAQSGTMVGIDTPKSLRRTARFRGTAKPGDEMWIEYRATVGQVRQDMVALEGRCGDGVYHGKDEPPYLVHTRYLAQLAKDITGTVRNPVVKARLIYEYVVTHVSYAYMPSYQTIPNLAEYGASMLRGDCGIQAALFINLLRESGIKAGWMGGMYVTPNEVANHDWAWFRIPGIEPMLYADCSFGGSALRRGDTLSSGFYFGNLDVMRLACTTALAYPGASVAWRRDPTDCQGPEAWLEGKTLERDAFEDTRRTLSFKVL